VGITWEFLAKYRSHYEDIESILFGVHLDSDSTRLLSMGQDRMLVEYDLEHSTTDNLRIQSSDRIEQSAVPTTLTWYPPISKEPFLLLCNSQYKMKLLNLTTKMCRKTLLGPTFGSPLRRLEVLPSPVQYSDSGHEIRRYAAFHTFDRVGLLLLPHDGNPHNSQSLIAHPTGVTAMATSYDGKYVFTAGSRDCTVNMWTTNTQALEAASQLGGEDLEPFYALLEGGRYGDFYAEMEEFFYYAQIKRYRSLPQDSVTVHRDTSLYTVHLPQHSTMYMYVEIKELECD
jgi:WD40 repeat protein